MRLNATVASSFNMYTSTVSRDRAIQFYSQATVLASMRALVYSEMATLCTSVIALVAGKRALAGVSALMQNQFAI